MLRFISIFFLIFALSANTQSTADILIEAGKTEVPTSDQFYSCLVTKPTIPGNIITFFMKFYNCMKFFKEISNAFTEWVSSPEEIKSTPDNA